MRDGKVLRGCCKGLCKGQLHGFMEGTSHICEFGLCFMQLFMNQVEPAS